MMAKVAHLVHLIDVYHQKPLCDVMVDDIQDDVYGSPSSQL
jgi:hypothetical protein